MSDEFRTCVICDGDMILQEASNADTDDDWAKFNYYICLECHDIDFESYESKRGLYEIESIATVATVKRKV